MGSRQQAGRGAAGNNNVRQNEYFVPRDGIDREVITADICRYLGNDALVRPGTYLDVGSSSPDCLASRGSHRDRKDQAETSKATTSPLTGT